MSDEYNRRVHIRMQEELAEFNTPQARYQQQLDNWWQSQHDLDAELDDYYEVGGYLERWSMTSSYTKSRRDWDWEVR